MVYILLRNISNKMLLHETTWMNLKNTWSVKEATQTQKWIYSGITFVQSSRLSRTGHGGGN